MNNCTFRAECKLVLKKDQKMDQEMPEHEQCFWVPTVEICENVEWVRENEINQDGIEESDLNDAATTYSIAVFNALLDKGWNVSWAKGPRMFYHGWNGAHFTTRCGCVASWAELNDEQLGVIEDARKLGEKSLLYFVEKAGRTGK